MRILDLCPTQQSRNLSVLPLHALFDDKEIINQLHLCESVTSREMV